jgi:hypothetical protein
VEGKRGEQLANRLEALGRRLGEREASHGDPLARARAKAEALHDRVTLGVARFCAAAEAAGAPALDIELGAPRLDDKHVRAVEFDLRRGRHGAVVTVKSRGEVTLVGPFQIGKAEGPCRSFPFAIGQEAEPDRAGADNEALEEALGDFLERFFEAALSP